MGREGWYVQDVAPASAPDLQSPGDHKGLLSLASVTDTWPKVLCAMTNMPNGSLAVTQ